MSEENEETQLAKTDRPAIDIHTLSNEQAVIALAGTDDEDMVDAVKLFCAVNIASSYMDATKLLGWPNSKAWKVYNSPDFQKAKYKVLGTMTTEEMIPLNSLIAIAKDRAFDYVAENAASRLKYFEILYTTAQGKLHDEKINSMPNININLVPPTREDAKHEHYIELDKEE